MLPALLIAFAALGIAVFRLWSYRMQMLDMARVLEEGRRLRMETLAREQELKYTMACISHDIRTPLAGAMGYLQLLEGDRQADGLSIVRKRLEELEALLDDLFLYTRLQSGSLPVECRQMAALPPLWDALAEFYPQFEAAEVEPELRFDRENMTVWASPEALGRVYRNLIVNALRHGGGGLTVSGRDGEICFSNDLLPGPGPDPEHLFDRFYQSSPARGAGGAGLGLSIVRELMEQMGGRASAQITGGTLEIRLTFSHNGRS